MKKIIPLALACVFSASAMADKPFSAELVLGSYNHEVSTVSDTVLGYGLRGVWQPHNHFAVEAAWLNYGTAEFGPSSSTYDYELSALSAGIKGIYPINDQFSIHARLGLAKWEFDVSGDGETHTYDDIEFYYAIGAEYAIDANIYAGLAYNFFEVNPVSYVTYEANGFQFYAGYRF